MLHPPPRSSLFPYTTLFRSDSDQVKQYVRHRMTAAGCRREVFADDGLLLISKATGGIMRRIDVLATRCLEMAAKGKSNLVDRSEEHTSELQSLRHLVCRLLL